MGDLYIVDAYLGLMKVGPEGGLAMPLVTEVEGVPLGFANYLDIDEDGIIYFTYSSIKYQRRNFLQLLFRADYSGRVLKYNPITKETTILIRKIQTLKTIYSHIFACILRSENLVEASDIRKNPLSHANWGPYACSRREV